MVCQWNIILTETNLTGRSWHGSKHQIASNLIQLQSVTNMLGTWIRGIPVQFKMISLSRGLVAS
jgi:hypothetical protein